MRQHVANVLHQWKLSKPQLVAIVLKIDLHYHTARTLPTCVWLCSRAELTTGVQSVTFLPLTLTKYLFGLRTKAVPLKFAVEQHSLSVRVS